jgi:hemerythrin-like domain-containing protein
MCLLHNAIIRGFNTIYLQAPHIQEADKADFIGYALTWFRFVKSHHDDEELNLFPKMEEVLGDKTIWTETHEEHGMSSVPVAPFIIATYLPIAANITISC